MAGFTQADLDIIRQHIASGVKSVTFADGRKAEYHSLGEMMKAEERIAASVASANPAAPKRRKFASFGNGC